MLELPITLIYYPEPSQSLAPPFVPFVVVSQNPSFEPSSSIGVQSEPVPLQRLIYPEQSWSAIIVSFSLIWQLLSDVEEMSKADAQSP